MNRATVLLASSILFAAVACASSSPPRAPSATATPGGSLMADPEPMSPDSLTLSVSAPDTIWMGMPVPYRVVLTSTAKGSYRVSGASDWPRARLLYDIEFADSTGRVLWRRIRPLPPPDTINGRVITPVNVGTAFVAVLPPGGHTDWWDVWNPEESKLTLGPGVLRATAVVKTDHSGTVRSAPKTIVVMRWP